MAPPLVSVIMPVYNGELYLSAAIDSIIAQTYQPVEIIAVDDGSTDGTTQIIRKYENVRYFYQTNRGVTAARNNGISHARGDMIAFLDQDDIWLPHKLTAQVNYLLEHPEVGFVLARQKLFIETDIKKPSWLKEEMLRTDQVGYLPGTLLARKSVFDKIGLFDTAYQIGSDTEWIARAKDMGIIMVIVQDVLLNRRIHNQNLSAQVEIMHPELVKLLKASIDRRRKLKKTMKKEPDSE